MPTHLIGLLLGTEEDWSAAFETLMARLAPRDLARRLHARLRRSSG